jgi:Fic family protein
MLESVGDADVDGGEAINRADNLDAETILAMHQALMTGQHPAIAGRWRDRQVWIGPGEAGPRLADFVAPAHQSVPELIDDLTAFMKRTDLPVLLQAAGAHAQFETIHPFADGNGRTGRALIHAILRNKGLTLTATVPVSAGLLTDTDAYFAAITAYRDGDLGPIVSMMSLASIRAVHNGRELVSGLREVRRGWDGQINLRRSADAWRLANLLVRQPVVTTETIQSELGVDPSNAARVTAPLEAAGILVRSAGTKRNSKVWRAPAILDQLDAFAERAGRRNQR